MFDFPVTVAEAPLKGVASTGDVDCMWCQVGYKTYFKWMETVPLRCVKSSCRSAFESEKAWKCAADCPRLRLFRAVKVMELTCHNLAVSYTNRISRFTSDVFRASGSPRTGGGTTASSAGSCYDSHVVAAVRCSRPGQTITIGSPSSAAFPEQSEQLKHSPVIQALIISVTESLYSQKYNYNEKNIPQFFLCQQHKTIGVTTVSKGFGEGKQCQPKNWSNEL